MNMTTFDSSKFYGLTVAQLLPDKCIAFGQIKNSISGTSLSGNWVFSQNEPDSISSVCKSHILISTKEALGSIEKNSNQTIFYGDFNELVSSIKSQEKDLKNEWEAYLLENPKKAKTLVSPSWANWSNALSIQDPIGSLSKSGRSAHPDSTPEEMKSLIALARMARQVLDIWRELEDSRVSRKFLEASKPDARLWPPDWAISERGPK
jgi:hypothetical protein